MQHQQHSRATQVRRFKRYPTDRSLTAVVFWDETPVRTIHGRCHVLGEGGLGAILSDRLYVGEVVRLNVPPVTGLYAAVRNARGAEHGFEFMFVRDSQRTQIKQLCTWCAKALDS